MRLDRFLVHCGIGSRNEVKKITRQKRVSINGKINNKYDTNINPETDVICVDGEELYYSEFYYYIMNKPAGYVSATEDNRDLTVIDLLDERDKNKELFPVGRLDKDTEGLLILTNDGKMAHNLLSPKKHIDKKYFVRVEGKLTEEDCKAFEQPMQIDEYTTFKPGKLEIISSGDVSEAYVIISEGKFHQVKKMIKHVGKEVIYLERVQMGELKLPQDIERGDYRLATDEELKLLKNYSK